MKKKLLLLPLLLLGLFVLGAGDSAAKDRFGMGVKVGTYGLGVDFGGNFAKGLVGVRGSLQFGEVGFDEEIDDIDYDGDLTLGGVGLLVDIYPMKGQFRLTGGLFANRNELGLAGTPTVPIEIGDNFYSPAEVGTLSGTIGFNSTAPYVGIGYGNVAKGTVPVMFMFDVGLVLQGAGEVTSFSSSTGLVSEDDLAAEIRLIEDDISDFDVWPVISIGISIRIF